MPGTSYAPGTKVYTINREKCVLAATIGTKNLEEGFHLNIAHIDSPRLDLRPVPVFEKTGIGYLRTHYYGGVRKYQWPTIRWPCTVSSTAPTAPRSTSASVRRTTTPCSASPICCRIWVPSRAPRRWPRALPPRTSTVIIASLPIEDKDAEQRVKLNVLGMLNEAYGITERDFTRAEIEVVPATRPAISVWTAL